MKTFRTIAIAGAVAMAAMLGISTANADPTVVRDPADSSNFIAIQGLTVNGALYDVELIWGAAANVYGQAPGVYTFTTQETASQAVVAMNAALNPEGNVLKAGSDGLGRAPQRF